MKNVTTRGFTLVEILIVVIIITILAGGAIFVYDSSRKQQNDEKRRANTATIAQKLEEYFAKNGSYPGVVAMQDVGTTVANTYLAGFDPEILVAPKAPSGEDNSITNNDYTGPDDAYRYYAFQNNTTPTIECSTASESRASCNVFALGYKEQTNGNAWKYICGLGADPAAARIHLKSLADQAAADDCVT